jgi:hypothetical protein
MLPMRKRLYDYWYTIKTFFMLQIAESRSHSPAIV